MADEIISSVVLEDGMTPILQQIAESLVQLNSTVADMAASMTAAFTGAAESATALAESLTTADDSLAVAAESTNNLDVATQASTGSLLENIAAIRENTAALAEMATAETDATTQTEGGNSALFGVHQMAILAGLGLFQVAKTAVDTATQYGTSMQLVQGLTGQTSNTMVVLNKAALQMALDFGVAPKQIADGFYFLLSAGLSVNDTLKTMKVVLEGSTGAMIDQGKYAYLLTTMMHAFGGGASQAAYYSDVLTGMMVKGEVTSDQLTGSFGRMLVGAELGTVGVINMAAAFDILTLSGEQGRQAETNLGSSLKDIMDLPDRFIKNAQKMNLPLDAAKFASDDLYNRLLDLGNAADWSQTKFYSLFTNKTTASTAWLLLRNQGADLKDMINQLSDATSGAGLTASAYAARNDTLRASFDHVKAAASVLAIAVVNDLTPNLKSSLGQMATLFTNLANYAQTHANTVKTVLAVIGAAFGGLATLLVSGFALKIGSAVGGTLGKLEGGFKDLKPAIEGAGKIFGTLGETGGRLASQFASLAKWFGGALLQNFPNRIQILSEYIGVVLRGAITFVANGMIHFADALQFVGGHIREGIDLVMNWRVWLTALWSALQGGLAALPALAGSIAAVAAPVLLVVGAIALAVIIFLNFRTQLMGVIAFLANAVRPQFQAMEGTVKQALSQIDAVWKAVWPKLKPAIDQLLASVKSMAPTFQVVATIIQFALTIIVNIIVIVVSAFLRALPAIANVFSSLFQIIGKLGAIVQAIFSGQFGKIPGLVGGILLNVLKLFGNAAAGVITFAGNLVLGVLNWVNKLTGGFLQPIINLVTNVVNWFKNLWSQIVGHSIIPDLVNGVIMWIGKLPGQIGALVVQMVGSFIANLSSLAGKVSTVIGQAISSLTGAITGGVGAVVTAAGSLVTGVITGLAELPGKMASAAANAVSSFTSAITNGVGGAINGAKNLVGNFLGTITGGLKIGSPSKIMQDIGGYTVAGFVQGVQGGATSATRAAGTLAQSFVGGFNPQLQASGLRTGGLAGAGAGGGGASGNQTVVLNLNGGLGAGLQLLNPSDRHRFATQIAQELGFSVNNQTIIGTGQGGSR